MGNDPFILTRGTFWSGAVVLNPPVIELRTLGPVELRASDGSEVTKVLQQPKRLALLVYLALASPGGFHSRDTLLATFWPDLSEKRARNALNKSVHFLRSHLLGGESVISRGATELGLDPEWMWCDARMRRRSTPSSNAGGRWTSSRRSRWR